MNAMPNAPDHAAELAKASDLLKRLAHPGRLMIVSRLMESDASVTELELELGIRQPGLSQQLAELRNAGLIEPTRAAKTVSYRLIDEDARAIIRTICERFCRDPAPVAKSGGSKTASARPYAYTPNLGGAVFARIHAPK